MPSGQFLLSCGSSDAESRVSENGAHYWLPNGILQEVEKHKDHLEKAQRELGKQIGNPYVDETKMSYPSPDDGHVSWNIAPRLFAETSLSTAPKKFKSLSVFGNAIICADKQNAYSSGKINTMILNPLEDIKCELYKWWWEQQAVDNDEYPCPIFDETNCVMNRGHWFQRGFPHEPSKHTRKHLKARMFEYNAEAVGHTKTRHMLKIDCHLGSKPQTQQRKQVKKLPYCRHYNDGYCKRGNNCEFQHVLSVAYPDSQKVFLGGLPLNITQRELSRKLQVQGFNVINEPSIMHKYAPQVCLRSSEQAQRLIKMGTIIINGAAVDVRRYEAVTKKQQERLADITKRSVFLGGLEKETTPKIIRCELAMIGMKVVNHLTIKSGFCPQVTLATSEQACTLVCKVKVQIKGKWVNVRPYVPKLLDSTKA